MDRNTFLNLVIDDGIYEIETNYLKPDQQIKREGGIKGFEICRGKTNNEILKELDIAKQAVRKAEQEQNDTWYWHWTMYQRQIEWVLNVLSAALYGNNQPPLTNFTVKGYLKAGDILGFDRPLLVSD